MSDICNETADTVFHSHVLMKWNPLSSFYDQAPNSMHQALGLFDDLYREQAAKGPVSFDDPEMYIYWAKLGDPLREGDLAEDIDHVRYQIEQGIETLLYLYCSDYADRPPTLHLARILEIHQLDDPNFDDILSEEHLWHIPSYYYDEDDMLPNQPIWWFKIGDITRAPLKSLDSLWVPKLEHDGPYSRAGSYQYPIVVARSGYLTHGPVFNYLQINESLDSSRSFRFFFHELLEAPAEDKLNSIKVTLARDVLGHKRWDLLDSRAQEYLALAEYHYRDGAERHNQPLITAASYYCYTMQRCLTVALRALADWGRSARAEIDSIIVYGSEKSRSAGVKGSSEVTRIRDLLTGGSLGQILDCWDRIVDRKSETLNKDLGYIWTHVNALFPKLFELREFRNKAAHWEEQLATGNAPSGKDIREFNLLTREWRSRILGVSQDAWVPAEDKPGIIEVFIYAAKAI